jgi:hypothetical protein
VEGSGAREGARGWASAGKLVASRLVHGVE